MDLKQLQQKWKTEDDMHPSIEFDDENIQKALNQQNRETKYAWILPLIMLAGLVIVMFTINRPEIITTRYILFTIIVAALGSYSIYALWTFYKDSRSIPVAQHIKRLKRRSLWLERFYGVVALSLGALSVVGIIFSDQTISEMAQNAYLLWLYVLVFVIFYLRKRRSRLTTEQDDISWEDQSVRENTRAVERYMWVLPMTSGAATLVAMLYLFGYDSDWMLGLFFGLLFVLFSGLYDYFKRKYD